MFLTMLFTFTYGQVLAQNKTVAGKVTSQEDGTGIPGATVKVKGTGIGTQTDIEGNYKLEVPTDAKTLEFSYVGYKTQSIEIGSQTTIDVKLVIGEESLNEVVVVGYGEQSKKTLTSSVTKISGASIANLATPSFDQQLAGRAAGVQVTQPSGILGQAPVIRIRGTNSITGGSGPLIVIDNVPVVTGNQSGTTNSNPLGDINPADIESYEVLKDGAATAIYGSRAAAGVILITTKRGKKNTALKVDFNMYVGVSTTTKRFDLLNSADFVTINNEKRANTTAVPNPVLIARGTSVNTNWQDQIFRTGVTQNYNLNFGGGTDKTTYFFSLGYTKQEGAVVANDMTRLSIRGNIDHNFNKWLEAGTSFSYTRGELNGINAGTNSLGASVFNAIRAFPNIPVLNPNNPIGGYNIDSLDTRSMGRWTNFAPPTNGLPNVKFALDNNINRNSTDRLISSSYAVLKVPYVDGLKIKTLYSLDLIGTRDFLSWDMRHGDGNGSGGRISQTSRLVTRWNWQNTVSYNKEFGDHSISAVAGIEYQKTTISTFTGGGTAFSDRFFLQEGLITGSYTTQLSEGGYGLSGFASTFARANYGFKNKYLASFTYRRDGISDLPTANRFGNFMGGSLGYRVSEEAFYKNSSVAKIMNEVKIRGSYAQVGNVDLGTSFPYLGLFGASQYASFNGIAFSQAGNPNLKWEASTKIDLGLELGFFNNRLNLEVDYFQNNISDLLLLAPTPSSVGVPGTGIGNNIARNVGSMTNSGLEVGINGDVLRLKNGFKWSASANLTFIKNEVTGLVKNTEGKDQDLFVPTGTNGNYHVGRVGNPLASFYGFQSAGVSPESGNPMYVKGDGKIVERDARTGQYGFYTPGSPFTVNPAASLLTGDISAGGDRRILGSAIPTWYGGFTNNFSFKGFDLEVFLRFSGGNSIMNVTRQTSLLNMDFANNSTEILNRWTTPGQITDVPRVVQGQTTNINQDGLAITRFLESGDFLRIQNIVLGYSLPSSLLSKTKDKSFAVRSVRIYAQVQNLATFTAYKGLDPEITTNTGSGQASNAAIGVDFNTNPIMRTITFGLNIGL